MKNLKKVLSLLLAVCMVVGITVNVYGTNMAEAASSTANTKPADGTTVSQPFASGTGGSTYFRIPALATLSDGSLVAAADARWNHTSDGYGLDTIVSRSSDDGENWSYTFANYLGDNGNVYNTDSTAFIDPALAVTSDDTIYMLVDLYPHGGYINKINAGTGFDSNGHLLLGTSDSNSYDYYVGDFTDGTASIYKTDGTQVADLTVDEYYNIKGTDVDTNLFFSDSPYQVLKTSYLYLTKSTDGGATWSAPQMLNSQVKNAEDKFYGVGPGRGLVTSTGRIIFPCYTYTTQDGNTSVIYSDDGGKTWTRSKDMSAQSSEAALAEADGNIYMFTRHGGYYLSEDNGETWSSKKSVGVDYTTTCQLSAITYSDTIDGKTAILLSAPTSSRTNGKIFVGLIQENGSISWEYTYSVNNGIYAYSCLTELSDGSVGLLYENASGQITYTNIAITNIAEGAQIGENEENKNICYDVETGVEVNFGSNDVSTMTVEAVDVDNLTDKKYVAYDITPEDYTGPAAVTIPLTAELKACENLIGFVVETDGSIQYINGTRDGESYTFTTPHFSVMGVVAASVDNTKDVTLYVGQNKTLTDSTGNYASSYTGSGLDEKIAAVEVKGTTVAGGTTKTLGSTVSMNSNETYTGVISDGDDNYLVLNGNSISNTTDINKATEWTVDRSTNRGSTIYKIKNGSYYLAYNNNNNALSISTSESSWSYSNGFYYSSGRSSYYLRTNNGNWEVSTTNSNKGQLYSVTTTTTAPVDATTITITGVAAGSTSVVVGNTQYNITVKEAPDYVDLSNTPFTSGTGQYSGQKVTKLTTSVNKSYDLNLNISGSSIVWSSADDAIAKVDQNGMITGVSSGETTITCTVNGVAYTIPVVVVSDNYGGSYDYTCDIRISEITSTTVRYSLNLSTSLLDAQEGEAIYLGYNYPFCINFFGVEDEGYALTYMASTNSAGNYYSLYQVNALSELAAYNGGAIKNQYNSTGFNTADVDAMLWYAVNEGYHGTMGWTRTTTYTGSSIYSDLTFRSEKLPTVTKTIKTVNGVDYTEGMTAKAGDQIVYDVTVTQYATREAITYSSVTLKDNLEGAKFSTNSSTTVSPSLSNSTLTANKTYSYEVTYAIQDKDLDTDIINTVDLSYNYSGQYSEGSYGGSAKAEAKISAPTFTPEDIVIDFGLPVTINYSGADAHGRYDLSRGTAEYGTVTVDNNIVTYTPDTVLRDIDTVTLTNTEGSTYTFKVYPATTVYYEEGFASYSGNWSGNASKGTGTQATEPVGNKTHNYGYDSKYANEGEASNDTQATSSENGANAIFEFTGTGVETYANCSRTGGAVTVQIRNAEGQMVKLASVDTTATGTYGKNVSDGAYNTPIVSVTGLTHGAYTEKVYVVKGTVNLDGFRVYGTLSDEAMNEAYITDREENPSYFEMRDAVLTALTVNEGTDSAAVYAQVYENTDGKIGDAVVLSNASIPEDSTDTETQLQEGPKNELYLAEGQALVFKINTNRIVQIGLKAPSGQTTYKIDKGEEKAISSSMDMFYTISENVSGEQTITITNTGDNVLSITKLKICDDPNAAFAELTESDFEDALVSLGVAEPTEPEVTYADASLTVQVGDATTVLTKNGVAGETATFTAAEVQEAAESLVADGYSLDDTAYTDVDVVYGNSDTVTFTASENIAVPEPTNIFQKIVNTVKTFFGKLFGR